MPFFIRPVSTPQPNFEKVVPSVWPQVGKLADVVAVRGNPLADVAALGEVVLVVLGGRVVRQSETEWGQS